MIEQLQYVPFDESTGGTAYDLSGKDKHLPISDGYFVQGKINNGLHFPDVNGKAEIIGTHIVDFNDDFTYTFWFRADIVTDFPNNTWLLYYFGNDNYLYLDANTSGRNWTYVSILQEGKRVSIYINGSLVTIEDFPVSWGVPKGFCLLNDNPHSSGGLCTIDELKVYKGVFQEGITPPATNMKVEYRINYETFKSFGVFVKQGDGFFDALKMKEPFKVDWADYHGEVLDLSDPRYEARKLTLDCFIYARTLEDFEEKIQRFMNKFYGAETKRLSVDTGSSIYNYEIYLGDGTQVKKKWKPNDMVGEFQLQLTEPQPIKRIIYFVSTGSNRTISISLTSKKPLSIYWGDGTHTDNVIGNGVSKSHTYSSDGNKYALVVGVIEEVSNLSTNGIITNGANSYF
jgi:hypothetical protein